MKNTILRIFNLIKQGELKFLIKGIVKRIYSNTKSYGLKRDLDIDIVAPIAKFKIDIRPYQENDDTHFFDDLQNDGLIEKSIPTCYVAVAANGVPCYRQWLMYADQNDKLQEFWGDAFPLLNEGEAIAESLFTIPKFRGNGVMPEALNKIALKAKLDGKRSVIAFVEVDNKSSLKGCFRAGFKPYILRTEKWFFLKRSISFQDVTSTRLDDYYSLVN